MKALKEKRIGLRSLLRRGLVILSLFALAFASCADSGDDGDGTGTTGTQPVVGPKATSIEIIESSLKDMNDSYEGLPVDLEGLKVLVRYDGSATNNKTVKATDAGYKFYTYPANAAGVVGMVTLDSYPASPGPTDPFIAWVPMRKYTLFLDTGESLLQAELTIPTVVPISRSATWTKIEANSDFWMYKDVAEDTEGNLYAWSKGLRLVGDLAQKIYVDDYPTFSKYQLQAEYANGKIKDIPLKPETDWAIRPRYDNPDDPYGKTGTGDLFVTIGKNSVIKKTDTADTIHPFVKAAYDYYTGGTYTYAGTDYDIDSIGFPTSIEDIPGKTIDPGLTVRHTYEEIWHVKSIKLVEDPGLDYFFYWESDEGTDWTGRLIAKGAQIEVTYTDGAPSTKKFLVEAATQMNAVWHNHAPGYESFEDSDIPFGVKGVKATSLPTATYPDGLPHARNRDPKITLYYRGQETTLAVPVYTRLMGIEPSFDGDNVPVDMRIRDNDRGAMDATAFSKLIKVTATFSAFSDPDKTAPLVLTFKEKFLDSAYDLTEAKASQGVPVEVGATTATNYLLNDAELEGAVAYSMDFGVPQKFNWTTNDWYKDGDSGWDPQYAGWGKCINPRNNGREVAVVLYYKPPVVYAAGVTSTSARNARVPVAWTNIGVK